MPVPELDKRFISHESPFSPQIGTLYPGPCRNSGGGCGGFLGGGGGGM